jgi:putative ABC transport system ATP-binding protein
LSLIECRGITKVYEGSPLKALDAVSIEVEAGAFAAITGKSGSGKTTLMNIVTGIDRPTEGEVVVAGQSLVGLDERALSLWRGRSVGVVFQFFQLLPTLTVAENVVLPMEFCKVYRPEERRRRALELLERFGIADQADKLPHALSGGQQQRAAIARLSRQGKTVLMITHEADYGRYATQSIRLKDGSVARGDGR